MKQLFDKIGLEQPSADFTSKIMAGIVPGYIPVPGKRFILKDYSFLFSYFLAILIVVPLAIPAVRHLLWINIQLIDIDINTIREWFSGIADFFSFNAISSLMIVGIVCSIMIGIFILESLIQFRSKSIS